MAPERTDWARIFCLWLCGVGAGMQFAKASVGFDALREHYATTAATAGWLLSSVGIVGVGLGATAGLLVARIGPRRSLIAALALGAVLSGFQASLPALPVFLASRIVEGAAHLAIIVAAPSCLPTLTAPHRRSVVMALWGTFFTVAFLVTGAIGPSVLAAGGLAALFAAHAIAMAALALLALWVAPADLPSQRDAAPRAFVLGHFEIYANPRTAIPALCFVGYTSLFLALQTLTPDLAPPEYRYAVLVGMPIASVVTTLTAGALAQVWISPFRLTVFAFATTFAASALLHLTLGHAELVAPVALARMACLSMLPGAIYPMIPRLNATPAMQARAYGSIAQLGNVGSVLGPPLFAFAASGLGSRGLLLVTFGLCVWGAVVAALAARRFET